MTRWPLHTGIEQWSLGLEFGSPTLSHSTFLRLLLEDRPAADLSFSATWLVSPWLGNLRPHPPGPGKHLASSPRQPLMEKPKKPSWHLSQAWPSTPGRQGHCPVLGWHWSSWEPSG